MCHPVSRVVSLPRVKYWEDNTVTIYIPSQQDSHTEESNWPELYTEIEEVETKEQEYVPSKPPPPLPPRDRRLNTWKR